MSQFTRQFSFLAVDWLISAVLALPTMRGATHTLSRLNVVGTLFVAVSFITTNCLLVRPALAASMYTAGPGLETTTPHTHPMDGLNGMSVAYAVPRNTPPDGAEVALLRPLTPSDVTFYQRALQLQQSGDFTASDKMLARVSDNSLVGIVLAQRYLSGHYQASQAELLAWWSKYANSPVAPSIYGLMQHTLAPANLPAPPHQILLPEQALNADNSTKSAYEPDSSSWRRLFVGGLSSWKQGNMQAAESAFSQTAEMQGIPSVERATSAFWAARAALRLQEPSKYLDWLHRASLSGNTFYGLLAQCLLGQTSMSSAASAPLTEADVTAVDSLPNGHLAFEMLQVGLLHEAQLALRSLWPDIQTTPGLGHAVMAVAAQAGLVDIAVALEGSTVDPTNELAGVQLPTPSLYPQGGFNINPALVYALARTESGFNPYATSPVGARGLMQLMPSTANLMRRVAGISGSITDPGANMAMGQAYIKYLADLPSIKGNLLAILASYNAGPGAASAWYGELTQDSDPLLFMESISNNQTRHFIQQVLADSWIYAEEIGIHPHSLNELAEGNFPTLENYSPASSPIETADAQ